MLSRVAAVMAPRTHNRHRVTGSSGRRREGRASEPQRPNMSRHLFYSAVLLLVLVICCGSGTVTAQGEVQESRVPTFEWKSITGGVTVVSLGAPGLLKVGSDVFAVAEAQCREGGDNSFTGIASQLLTIDNADKSMEVLNGDEDKTQFLEDGTSEDQKKRIDVSRPTTVVKGNDIYMLVGKYSRRDATDQEDRGAEDCGLLLVKGKAGGESSDSIIWGDTAGVPCVSTVEKEKVGSTRLIGGGGSGVKMHDDALVFPVEGKKKEKGESNDEKTVSLLIYTSEDNAASWKLSKGMSDGGCGDPSVVEWGEKDKKLMMMTACDDGRRRVYESGDKGDSWTEALGTLSRVWSNKHEGNEKGVGSGFITAKIGDGDDEGNNRNVMLVTLPVYAKENGEKGELHLWLTDNTHIVGIGSVSGDDEDAAASALLYKSGEANEEELIALYEKKKTGDEKPSPGMVSVRLTEQLKRVKDVLTTWKKVDERVSKLCPTSIAEEDTPTANACSTDKITDGLVGFLSGNFSENTWKDEYLGVNATVNNNEGAATVATENRDGVRFTGAWAEWPVGRQGENQLYHFANYNFTLVATVSIHGVLEESSPIPLIGVKMNDGDRNPVLLGLSYDSQNKWQVLCSGGENKDLSNTWEPETQYQVAIVLQNGTQGSAYVDGQRVCESVQSNFENAESKGISHFYIGGDGGNAESTGDQEGVSVTVSNVLLYNRPLGDTELIALNANKVPLSVPEDRNELAGDTDLPAVSGSDLEGTVSLSNAAGQKPLEEEPLRTVGGGGVSSSVSVTTTPSSDVDETAATGSGDTMRGIGSPQTPEVSVSFGEDEGTVGGTNGQEEVNSQNREVNATALNSSLGKLSQGNNSDGSTMRGSGLLPSLLLLLGLWVFAAL
ncbi:putative trans-sialidase [Trypanosoma cruzi]|nr:putative trans-sialidase [Trypanosoma cruzi]